MNYFDEDDRRVLEWMIQQIWGLARGNLLRTKVTAASLLSNSAERDATVRGILGELEAELVGIDDDSEENADDTDDDEAAP